MSTYYENIRPLHPVRCSVKVTDIATSMRENDWVGEPLLVIHRQGEFYATTGTHRIQAAKWTKTPLKKFVVVIPDNEPPAVQRLLDVLIMPDVTDYVRYAALLELAKMGVVSEEAVRILKAEVDKHTHF